jgi:hypothetical protein
MTMARVELRPHGTIAAAGAGRPPRPRRAWSRHWITAGALLACLSAGPGHAGPGATRAASNRAAPAAAGNASAGAMAAQTSAPATGSTNAAANAAENGRARLRAHTIVYRASFKGIGAGTLELTLRPDAAPGSWVYETRAHPSFLASFVINPKSRERSSISLDAAGRVAPHSYRLDDGTPEHKDDMEIAYDYARGRAVGKAHGQAFELALEPGTQDAMSIRLAASVDLLAGREPAEYPMIDGNELKHFVYHRVGSERIHTALGELDTVIYTSVRKGAGPRDRTWRYWYAPSLDSLPVRIEQREDGKTRFEFEVRSFKWL